MLEIMKQKSRYMLEKPWYCDICLNNRNYSLAGMSRHLSTRMHKNKAEKLELITSLVNDICQKS